MPIPKEEDKIEITAENTDLGDLGPGFPLYFEFMKYLCYLMLYLTGTFSLPYAILIYQAYSEIINDLDKEETKFGLYSFGALIQHARNEDMEHQVDYEARQKNATYLIFQTMLSGVLTMLILIWMRGKLAAQALKLDVTHSTASDFCLQGFNLDFEDTSAENIDKELREYFKENFDITDIVYTNPAYQIKDF